MEFGFALPPRGPMATPENIATLAQQGEAMGFGILAITDHIIFPQRLQSTYPAAAAGSITRPESRRGSIWRRSPC